MPTELAIHAVNRGGMVVTAGDANHTVTMDHPRPGGESAELAVLTPLRKMRQASPARTTPRAVTLVA